QMANIATNEREFKDFERDKEEYRIRELNFTPGKHLDPTHAPMALDKDAINRSKKRGSFERGYQLKNLRDPKELEIEHRLESPVPNLNLKATPLRQALEDLGYLSGINIVPDTAALQEHSISLDSPLSLKVENISLKSALNLLLHKVHLTWIIKDQVLQVTTEDRAKGRMVQRVFPVGDLVIPVADSSQPNMPTLVDVMNGYNQAQQTY